MKILVLGGNSMLGHKLVQEFSARHEVHATFRGAATPEAISPVCRTLPPHRLHGGVDALALDSVAHVIAAVQPAVVVNCIGIIKQLRSAHDSVLSISVNALFPHQLARLCADDGARLIHFSTDCVFSGRRGHYVETDFADDSELYGRTKFLGEVAGPGALTLRTSFIGRDHFKQVGLLEWFVSQRHGRVRGYRRFIYSGVTSRTIARIVAGLIEDFPALDGLYHVASAPISKYDLLVRLAAALRLDIAVEPCDEPACDRSLDASRFLAATGRPIPTWDEMIADLAADPTPYDLPPQPA